MRAVLSAAVVLLCSCGPSLTEVRTYVAHSPHRRVAVFPFDAAPSRPQDGPAVASLFESKLRAEGLVVADRAKTRKVYEDSLLSRGAFADVADAATFSKSLGCQAALIGRIESIGERVDVKPAVYIEDPAHPYRRRLAAPEQRTRLAQVSLRLRLVDSARGAVLWEAAYGAELRGSLANVEDAVSSVLIDQLSDAYLKQGL